ncbi:hypothetical protein C8F04DRAFT_1193829 [Mycena alexandri]|uniref:Uncharacterized protein n=1 Tax=Mycena alexandri TaxID=1745969 RepID=A0AAD6S876_9AGAR|nr:hypothetical protein C8F04DRAFT_1193829 [Mycena alexandri]
MHVTSWGLENANNKNKAVPTKLVGGNSADETVLTALREHPAPRRITSKNLRDESEENEWGITSCATIIQLLKRLTARIRFICFKNLERLPDWNLAGGIYAAGKELGFERRERLEELMNAGLMIGLDLSSDWSLEPSIQFGTLDSTRNGRTVRGEGIKSQRMCLFKNQGKNKLNEKKRKGVLTTYHAFNSNGEVLVT